MRRNREHRDFLHDMLVATEKALQFTTGVSFEAFAANEEKVYATVRALELIGEAARRVPASVQAQYPTIPWADIIGMRRKLIHDYFQIALPVLWRTVTEDLLPLRSALLVILRDLDEERNDPL